MASRPLSLSDCWYIELARHHDDRGWLSEAFNREFLLEETGREFDVAQVNVSRSLPGVIRGLHYSTALPGQAKYVQCLQGTILDVVVDLRQGSPTFGRHESVLLSELVSGALLIPEGFGHAFAVIEGPVQVMYATSSPYDAASEFAINPLDPELGLPWPAGASATLSLRDRSAPSLSDAIRAHRVPRALP